MFKIMSWCFKK